MKSMLPDGSSHRICSVKGGVLKNFVKFTGKHVFHVFYIVQMVPNGATHHTFEVFESFLCRQ